MPENVMSLSLIKRVFWQISSKRLDANEKLPFLPNYIRFQVRGHAQAWRIFTHMTKQELLALYRLVLNLSSGSIIVEIGSYLGASTCFLAAGASELGGKVYCVDTWQNEGMTEGSRDTFSIFYRNTTKYRNFIKPLRGKSIQIAESFSEKIDLLFIDGDHSYEGTKSDVESWLPHLKSGGLVIMHDSGWAEGVKRVINENIEPMIQKKGELPNMYWAWLNN
jgi:predicted O-methyltransferase YrrM